MHTYLRVQLSYQIPMFQKRQISQINIDFYYYVTCLTLALNFVKARLKLDVRNWFYIYLPVEVMV